jgi:hypothetical protein
MHFKLVLSAFVVIPTMAAERCFPPKWLPLLPMKGGHLDRFALTGTLSQELVRVQNRIENKYSPQAAMEFGDYSVYTGAAGVAYMFFRLSLMENAFIADSQEQLLNKATSYIDVALRLKPKESKTRRVSTFLTGLAGVYSVAAAIYFAKGETRRAARMCKEVLSLAYTCATEECPSELLFGRCGYLSCLLFLAANAGFELADASDIITDTLSLILEDGKRLAGDGFSLMWEWHEKRYLGAAHGLCGILLVLLHFRDVVAALGDLQLVKDTIDQLLRTRFPSGNLPSSVGSDTDRLVHWCHGAPGLVPLLLEAHAAFGEPAYLAAAADAARVVRERGLLRKGFGLCHGTSGNGLALLALHRATPSDDHLHNALRFGLFACSPADLGASPDALHPSPF